jgi:hypothetical protein
MNTVTPHSVDRSCVSSATEVNYARKRRKSVMMEPIPKKTEKFP